MKSFLLLLGLLVTTTACSDSKTAFSSINSENAVQGAPLDNANFLQRMAAAPRARAYHGQREIRFYVHEDDGRIDELSYLEAVVSDGDGRFTVVPLEVFEPDMSPERRELFRMVQRGREEFFFNHRDFQIRNLDLFQANYSVMVAEPEHEVLGQSAMSLLIRNKEKETGHYEVEVGLESGLVLQHREYDDLGRLVSELKFTELVVGPLAPEYREQVRQHTPNWRPAVAADTLGNEEVNAPRVAPDGYQLLERRVLTDPQGQKWYELIYADGVEQLFMLFALGETSSNRVTSENEVAVYGHGAWTVVEGKLRSQRVIALGKIAQQELLLTLESCL